MRLLTHLEGSNDTFSDPNAVLYRHGAIEQWLLVLEHIFVVSRWEPLHCHHYARHLENQLDPSDLKPDALPTCPKQRPDFPLSSSSESGFFFWGIIEDPVLYASLSWTKPNSALL